MRLLLFLVVLLPKVMFAAKINCHFIGAPHGDRFTIRVAKYYLDGTAQNYDFSADASGFFSADVYVPEPQFVTLQHQAEVLVLYVEPDDEINLNASILEFPVQVHFSGKGKKNNTCLHGFFRTFPVNFNEFSKVRYKIANYWSTIDEDMDQRMKHTPPADFSLFLNDRSKKQLDFIDAWDQTYSDDLSAHFKQFMITEIMYRNAFEALVYANVYKNWHSVSDEWVSSMVDMPLQAEYIGSEQYRRFLMTFMAHRCKKANTTVQMVQYQFHDGGQLLSDKPRAFLQSELIFNAMKEENYTEAMPIYSSFLVENTIDAYEQKITDVYERVIAFSPGAMAPTFAGVDQSGKMIRSDDLRGKLVYLNFWASYCGSCIRKIDYLNTRFGELDRQSVAVLNVSIDQAKELWQEKLVQHNVSGINLLNLGDQTTDLAKDFKVEAVPTYFIIDKNGMFVQKPISSKPEDLVKYLLERGTN
jgi:peroxiredoxin